MDFKNWKHLYFIDLVFTYNYIMYLADYNILNEEDNEMIGCLCFKDYTGEIMTKINNYCHLDQRNANKFRLKKSNNYEDFIALVKDIRFYIGDKIELDDAVERFIELNDYIDMKLYKDFCQVFRVSIDENGYSFKYPFKQ